MPSSIGLHLIGAGCGESIIVELPNGDVGVVDCCASKLDAPTPADRIDANPTIRFISNKLKKDRLAFLALTHPHEDHARGMSQLLRHFEGRIDRLWIYDSFEMISVSKYFAVMVKHGLKLPLESELFEEPGTFAEELADLRILARDQHKVKSPPEFVYFKGPRTIPITGELKAHFVGPPDSQKQHYIDSMANGLSQLIDDDSLVLDDGWLEAKVNHNLISPALILEYGKLRILLGGDMDTEAWEAELANRTSHPNLYPHLVSNCIKVSHHCSTTGYCDGLYEQSARARTVAIMTPFNRHRHPLPKHEGVKHVQSHVAELLTTSLANTYQALAIDRPVMSHKWHAILKRSPSWGGVLDPSLLLDSGTTAPAITIPDAMVPLLRAEPDLVLGLRHELRRGLARRLTDPPSEDFNRISLYFNEQGDELKRRRYVGKGAGPVVLT